MTEVITRKVVANEEDLNRDPITGTPGAHALGTGAGAAAPSATAEPGREEGGHAQIDDSMKLHDNLTGREATSPWLCPPWVHGSD